MLKKLLLTASYLLWADMLLASQCPHSVSKGDEIIFYGDTHGFHTNRSIASYIEKSYHTESLALMVHLGDIKNYGEKDLDEFFSAYSFLLTDDNKFQNDNKVSFVLGNHDYTDTQKLLKDLEGKLKVKRSDFSRNELTKIVDSKGNLTAWLITLNTKTLDKSKSYIYNENDISSQITRFKDCIKKEDLKAPVFIASHEGYHDTHHLPYSVKKWFKNELPYLLKDGFPNRKVVVFNGHKHHYVPPKRFENVAFINAPRAGAEKSKGGLYGYISCKITQKKCILMELSNDSIYQGKWFNF